MDHKQEPGAVRLQEVAEAAGVSTITVSRALGNPGRVSERTRTHVLEVAERMGYIPNRLASGLASSRSMVIGLIVSTVANPIHGVMMQGVADVVEPAGYKLLLGNSHFSRTNEFELVRTFIGYRADGIILTGRDHTDECIELLRRAGTPVVEMFDYNSDPIDLNVGSSNFEAGQALGRYLIARGRTKLAYVGHVGLNDSRMAARYEGLIAACRENDLRPPRHYAITSDPGTGEGGEVLGSIMRDAPDTDGVMFAGHQVAAGAIQFARDASIDVPGRVAIVSYGDSPVAQWVRPSLTTVRFPHRETGVHAGRLLLERLAGRLDGKRSVRLGFEIVSRESA